MTNAFENQTRFNNMSGFGNGYRQRFRAFVAGVWRPLRAQANDLVADDTTCFLLALQTIRGWLEGCVLLSESEKDDEDEVRMEMTMGMKWRWRGKWDEDYEKKKAKMEKTTGMKRRWRGKRGEDEERKKTKMKVTMSMHWRWSENDHEVKMKTLNM